MRGIRQPIRLSRQPFPQPDRPMVVWRPQMRIHPMRYACVLCALLTLPLVAESTRDSTVQRLEVQRSVEGRFDVPRDVNPGAVAHRYGLPEGLDDVPWRLVVAQDGIDVRVVEVSKDGPGDSLNFHLDRYEEEVFRLAPGLLGFEIRPVDGGERRGTYTLRLELPIDEDPNRRRLEMHLSDAARVEHGGAAEGLRLAAELYESVADELADGADLVMRARALLGAANHRRVLGDGPRAHDHYTAAAEIWRRLDEPGWLAASLVGVGQSARRLRQLDAARTVLEEALDLWRSLPGRDTEITQTESNLGLVAHVDGDYPRAVGHYRRALEGHRAAGNDLEVANVSHNLGAVLAQLGDAEAALERRTESLEIFRRLGDRRGEFDAVNGLAGLRRRMADFEEALLLYGEARELAVGLGDLRLEGRALNNRGWVYLGLGQFERAAADCELGRKLSRRAGDTATEIVALTNLAQAKDYLGHADLAWEHWSDALALAQAGDDIKQIELLAQLGRLGARLGTENTEETFRQAWVLHAQRGNVWDAALLHMAQGEARAWRGEHGAALEAFQAARREWQALGDGTGETLSLIHTGRSQRALGDLAAAHETLWMAVERVEDQRLGLHNPNLRAAYLAQRLDAHELLIDTLVDLAFRPGVSSVDRTGRLAAALEVSEGARSRRLLDGILEPRPSLADPETVELLERRRQVASRASLMARRQELVALGRQRRIEGENLEATLADLRAEIDRIDSHLRRRLPRHAVLTSPADLEVADMQALLDEESVLLHYFLGAERSHVWLMQRDSLRHAVLPPRSEIEAAALRVHRAWSAAGGSRQDDTEAATELSRMLLGPLTPALDELHRSGSRRLVILPVGALHYVPFAALAWPKGAGRGFLIQDFEIVRLPSMAVLRAERALLPASAGQSADRPMRLTVLADPVFDPGDPRLHQTAMGLADKAEEKVEVRGAAAIQPGSVTFGRLPGTDIEARAIVAHLPSTGHRLALGFDANRETLSKGLESSTLVHLATHGLIDTESPESSGIVLSQFHPDGRRRNDGFLRVYDIYAMRLDAELVVLSGCRTALGKTLRGEAFQGLTSAFLHAGARRVMSSLWAVADRTTATWMDYFYRALLEEGRSPAAAMRQAQLAMLEDRRYADPYYWAPFVLQGDWRF